MLGTANSQHIADLVAALVDEEVARGIHLINMAIDNGSDPRQFGQQIVTYLRNVMLAQTASVDLVDASQEERAQYEDFAGRLSRARLLKAIRVFNTAVNTYTGGWQPQLSLELALIEISLEAPTPVTADAPRQAPAASRPQSRTEAERVTEKTPAPTSADDKYVRAEVSAPGEPPVYSATKIHAGWMEILTQVHRYNRSIPPLLEHAHVRGD